MVGVVRTSGEWLDDSWVLSESRGHGVGVCSRRVKLKSSPAAMKYCIFAWFNRMQRRSPSITATDGTSPAYFPQKFPITMLEMFKRLHMLFRWNTLA